MKKIRWHVVRLAVIGVLLICVILIREWGGIPGLQPLYYSPLRGEVGGQIPIYLLLMKMIFWTSVAVLLYSLFAIVAYVLDASGKGTPFLREIAHRGVIRVLFIRGARGFARRLSLGGKLSLWGVVVFLLVVGLGATGRLNDTDAYVARFIRPTIRDFYQAKTLIMNIYTPDNNVRRYLHDVSRVTHDLLEAGARVVLVPMPDLSWHPQEKQLIDSLRANKRLVLFEPAEPQYKRMRVEFPPQEGKEDTTLLVSTTSEDVIEAAPIPEIFRWYPFMRTDQYRLIDHPDTPKWVRTNQIDLALAAAARFFDFPADTLPHVTGNTVTYGTIRIPVTRGGIAYSQYGPEWGWGHLHFYARHEPTGDSLQYVIDNGKVPLRVLPSTEAYEVSGRIILVWWGYGSPFPFLFEPYPREWAYRQIIESVTRQSFLVKYEIPRYILSALAIALSCFLVLKARLSVAVTVTILTGFAIFGFGVVALRMFHFLFDAGYPLVASLLCAAILPLVRLAHETR